MSWTSRRRFWTSAGVRPDAGGFAVALDARILRTPAGVALCVPTEALAAAIAAEWDALEAEIDPRRLPLTRLANSAIDRVEPQRGAVAAAIAEYGATDLVCYRAERPEALVARQADAWDPWLRWARLSLGAPLIAVGGVIHRSQAPASVAALERAVTEEDAFGLVSLHDLVTLSGSLVLGLAVHRGALDAAAAWSCRASTRSGRPSIGVSTPRRRRPPPPGGPGFSMRRGFRRFSADTSQNLAMAKVYEDSLRMARVWNACGT